MILITPRMDRKSPREGMAMFGIIKKWEVFTPWKKKRKKKVLMLLGHFLQKRTTLKGIRSIQSRGQYYAEQGKDVVPFRIVKRQQMYAPCGPLPAARAGFT